MTLTSPPGLSILICVISPAQATMMLAPPAGLPSGSRITPLIPGRVAGPVAGASASADTASQANIAAVTHNALRTTTSLRS